MTFEFDAFDTQPDTDETTSFAPVIADTSLIALHLGETCGFILGKRVGFCVSGAWNLAPNKQATSFAKLAWVLDDAHRAFPIRRVVYRIQARRKSKRNPATALAFDLVALVNRWAEAINATCERVPDLAVMRSFRVSGNASAETIADACVARGFMPATPAEAHAIATFHHATQI